MSDPIADLPPEIAALLRRAEPYPEAPASTQLRVRNAVLHRIALAADTGVTDEPPVGDAPTTPPTTHPASLFSWAARPAWSLAATFIVGTTAGASLHAVLRPPRDRIVYVERPAPSPAPSTNVVAREPPPASANEIPAAPSASSLPNVAPPLAGQFAAPDKSATTASDLEAEQKLLDAARNALTRGRAEAALGPIDRHTRQYPKGILAEEREALAVNVLVSLGRHDEARDRGSRFLKRYPDSLLRTSVEAAMATIR